MDGLGIIMISTWIGLHSTYCACLVCFDAPARAVLTIALFSVCGIHGRGERKLPVHEASCVVTLFMCSYFLYSESWRGPRARAPFHRRTHDNHAGTVQWFDARRSTCGEGTEVCVPTARGEGRREASGMYGLARVCDASPVLYGVRACMRA